MPTATSGDELDDDDLHAVRIKAKHARYAAELAARSERQELTRSPPRSATSRT